MSEPGPEPGAAGVNRRFDRGSGVPPIDAVEPDEDQRTTTALPRPAEPPRAQPPVDTRYDSPAARPTTALPRTPAPQRYPAPGFVSGYPDPAFPTPARPTPTRSASQRPSTDPRETRHTPQQTGTPRGGYTGATPSGAGDRGFQRLDPRAGQAPVGPSWAPQHPYDDSARRADHRGDRGDAATGRPVEPPQYQRPESRDAAAGYQYPDQGGRSERNRYGDPQAGSAYPAAPHVPAPQFLAPRDDQAERYGRGYADDRGYPEDRDHQADHGYAKDPERGRRDQPAPGAYEGRNRLPAHDYPPRYPEERYPEPRDQGDDTYRRPADRDRADRDHAARDYAAPDYPQRDYADREPAGRDHADYPDDDGRARNGDFRGERDGYDQPPTRRPPPRGSHLPPYSEPLSAAPAAAEEATPPWGRRSPRKLTVTRVAAFRSRELTHRGVELFHKATTADGADKSGLTSLTYAVMANYAVDAALAVALAGTLFFAAATAESTGRVLLYLVITVAPFAVIAPFIGPMLDRLQSGRRLALAVSSFGRALLALLMAFNFSNFNPWVIYPCALGNLVLSKAFGVLKAALTPRVLPEQITLVKTNSRLTTFGMIAGGVAGAVAAGLSKVTGSPGALFFTAACAIAGGVLCLRIPAWVESTEGEVPVKEVGSGSPARGFPQIVRATLWANSVIRVETGFLALFIAFVVKSQYPSPEYSAFTQLLLLGVVGGAAGVGGFVGNTMGARLTLSAPETISIFALVSVLVSTVIAVLVPGLATAAIVGFVGSTASALAKVSLDSVIQHHLPEESRASAFGKSESVLQLGWVFGGVVGLLLGGVWTFGHASVYAIGFGTVTLMLVIGLVQSYLVRSGRTMFPKLSPHLGRRAGGSRSTQKQADGARQPLRGDTDRLTRPAPAATAHLPAVEADRPRRRPRKAGGDR